IAFAAASKNTPAPKIAAVTINAKKNYILSTLGNTPATDILKHRANVESTLKKIDKSILHIEGDKKWYKLIIHGVSLSTYDDTMDSMARLRSEIESYNPSVSLLNHPR